LRRKDTFSLYLSNVKQLWNGGMKGSKKAETIAEKPEENNESANAQF
jgi:hypothetical protein